MDKTKFNRLKPWETLDPWQKDYINETKDCILIAGRQVGKTTAMSIKIGELARQPNRDILIGALTEKQAFQVFFKALTYINERYPNLLVTKGKDKPTKHEFRMKNGTVVRNYALGLAGMGMRTFTITDLFIDECREINREVFVSLEPMLSVTKGSRNYASTPGGKRGYFWEASQDPSFRKFEISAEDCTRHDKEFLEKQRKTLSKVEYAQEYLGKFLDEVLRVFSEEILKDRCTAERKISQIDKIYAGVDIARLGNNKTVIAIGRKINKDRAEQIEQVRIEKELTTAVTDRILELHKQFKVRKWGIDGAGVGGGVIDQCRKTSELRYKVEDLNNASKFKDEEGNRSDNVLKTDMYINLLRMLEHKELVLLNDENLIESLANAMYEYDEQGKMRIFGTKNDEREAVIRMAWLIAKDKSLNLWVSYT